MVGDGEEGGGEKKELCVYNPPRVLCQMKTLVFRRSTIFSFEFLSFFHCYLSPPTFKPPPPYFFVHPNRHCVRVGHAVCHRFEHLIFCFRSCQSFQKPGDLLFLLVFEEVFLFAGDAFVFSLLLPLFVDFVCLVFIQPRSDQMREQHSDCCCCCHPLSALISDCHF